MNNTAPPKTAYLSQMTVIWEVLSLMTLTTVFYAMFLSNELLY